jgi:hypothetical protein
VMASPSASTVTTTRDGPLEDRRKISFINTSNAGKNGKQTD